MSDEKFEEFLQREAAPYNAPPSVVPRDEMWQVIAAARAAAPPAGVTPLGSRRARSRLTSRLTPWIGMAATLVLGVGIGRFVLTGSTPTDIGTPATPNASAVAAAPALSTAQELTTGAASVPEASLDAAVTQQAAAPQPAPRQSTTRQPSTRQPSTRQPTARRVAAGTESATTAGAATAVNGSEAFQVASREHLLRAEALVTVVAATPRDVVMDSLMGKWAREMLTNTRLLLDSPAGDDPVRRRLLEDLETLLVQLVQRSGGAVNERDLIDRTLDRTQLLTRLRASAVGI